MINDTNPYRALSADISPIDFEVFCMETLKTYAEREKLHDFSIAHNQKINTHDGNYQIDVIGEFTALGTKIKVIVECKKYTRPVGREEVSVLHSKQHSLGANKSILISTTGFQSGAVRYAQEHGIALIQIINESVKYIQGSAETPNRDFIALQMLIRKQLPKHIAMQWNCEADYPFDEIYPTEEMHKKAFEKIRDQIK